MDRGERNGVFRDANKRLSRRRELVRRLAEKQWALVRALESQPVLIHATLKPSEILNLARDVAAGLAEIGE